MNKSLWQETVRVNAHKEDLESCNKYKGRICTKEEKSIPVAKRRKRGGTRVHQGTVKKRVY